MLPLRYARRWCIAGVVLLLLVFAAMLLPTAWLWPQQQEPVVWIIDIDKWLHLLTFVILAIWFAGQFRPGSYWRIGVGLLLFGAVIEVCQHLVAYRSAEWFDIAANTVGIAVGLVVATTGPGGWSLHFERWLLHSNTGAGID